ncbi:MULTISPECIES: FUSC family protein [unclassified Streptomyces]|uniref:FUSC family protein n=1 Tax=unclassified Streptomyces TaxID=2593676 RepID=UPI000DC7C37D|nr:MULTISPECIES: FUSC family protein [unclassified Streptomyces]AWZ03968.1 FUSC family protein [Streptomyces sp. ICC4]AWZ11480.1 FUSC family protein [Streptomyces sp. ICC1]
MSWLRALKETARSGLKVERTRLEPLIALRGAAGLAIVIGVSLALLGPGAAASSAFGAFMAAIATFQQSWRPRPVLALASGLTLAASTFIGYLVGSSHTAAVLALLTVWTFAAAMAWVAGPTTGIIASSNVAILLVTVTLPTSVAQAAGHAALIAAGGVVQAALIVLLPVRRWGAQRDALADALAAEADYARRLRHDPVAPFDPQPLMTARAAAAVTRSQARRRPGELHGARGLAEHIRLVLALLADPAAGAPEEGPARDRVRDLLAAAATVLDTSAHAIRHGQPVGVPGPALAVLKSSDTGDLLTGAAHRAAGRLAALLDDVLETAAPGTGSAPPEEAMLRPTLPRLIPLALKAVRAELRPASPVFRHAMRVSAVVPAGYLIGHALPFGHTYWAPMASVMVMRPDFTQTYSRAVGRFGGTLVGVALATGIVQLAQPGTYLSGFLAVISAGLVYVLMRTGYAVSQVFVSAYVVFLLGMAGGRWDQTVTDRVALTLIGGLLAMAAYALYPAWETPRLRPRLADWLAANGRYAAVVLSQYADPPGARRADVREALLAVREARIAWHDAVERASGEPVRHRGLSRAAADDAGQALALLGRNAMLLEAYLPERGQAPVPGAGNLAAVLRTATEQAARQIRERKVPDWTPVRAALPPCDTPDSAVLFSRVTLLADALDDLSNAVRP